MSLDKPASLSLIARANGKPTGDELVMARDEEEARIKREEWLASGLDKKRFRKFQRMLRKVEDHT